MADISQRYRTISELGNLHRHLYQLFINHQILLMKGESVAAFTALEQFRTLIIRHIEDEEKWLIPAYEKALRPAPAGGAVEFYLREHILILRQIDLFYSFLGERRDKPLARIELVELFDKYIRFKDLLDHHDARERIFLYRLLDKKLPQAKRDHILGKMTANIAGMSDEQ